MFVKSAITLLLFVLISSGLCWTPRLIRETPVLSVDSVSSDSIDDVNIINGKPAQLGQIPYQVRLEITTSKGSFLCGGSIIRPNFVVSAAHCAYDNDRRAIYNPISVTVVAGDLKRSVIEPTEQRISAKNLRVHPSYDPKIIQNDLLLIQLESPFTINDYVQPIALPAVGSSYDNKPCVVSGWGVSTIGSRYSSEILLYGNVSGYPAAKCAAELYRAGAPITGNNICIKGNSGACNGDSGGPVVCPGIPYGGSSTTKVLAGAVSWGMAGCPAGYPSVNTNIATYTELLVLWMRSMNMTATTRKSMAATTL